jgi:hypothetical protein
MKHNQTHTFKNSQSIRKGTYNFFDRQLLLEFANQKKVCFTHVPKMFWYNLLDSESAERFVVKELFPNFQYFETK